MDQTPIHDIHNAELLQLMPQGAAKVIEIGCSSGALAREYRKANPACHYFGIEIVPAYAAQARRHCDFAETRDIDAADEHFFAAHADRDCWVFGDVLEHLRDPWRVLAAIRAVIPAEGSVVACMPNAQHWSLLAKLSIGDFRYESSGLLDRTHLRWFTRQTMFEMFEGAGFRIEAALARIVESPATDIYLPHVRALAAAAGGDPDQAAADAIPLQYVMRAVPA